MPLNLKSIFSAGAEKVAGAIGKAFDDNFSSREEMARAGIDLEKVKAAVIAEANRHIESLETNALHELELYNADRDSARDMNAKVQESDKASWLAKNVAYILDLTITTAVYVLVAMIAFVIIPEENKELFYMVVGVLLAKWGDIVSFHRGTSKGSEDKAKTLDRISRVK